MKKTVIFLISILLFLSPVATAFRANAAEAYYPNVHLRGNGSDIVDEDGRIVYDFDVSGEQIKEIAERVLPLLLKGLVTNDLDDYYEAAAKEMQQLYDHALLDKNGDPQHGTNVAPDLLEENRIASSR